MRELSTHIPRLLFGALAAVAVALNAQTALAQGAALVDPASIVYRPTAGEAVSGKVRLSNPGASLLRLRLYVSDWHFDPVGQFDFENVGTLPRSASTWVDLPLTTLELAPREAREITYTLNVPADAESGTHWTVIFAESEPSAPEPGQPAATISVRVGHIIYVNLPELRSDGTVLGLFGEPPAEPGRPYTIIAQYANIGNAAQSVAGNFTLRNGRGEVVIDVPIERSVVLPASDRAFVINVHGPLDAGNYTALVVLNFGDEERDVAGSLDFVLDTPLTEPVNAAAEESDEP